MILSDNDDNLCIKEPLIVPIINCSDISDIASSKLSIGAEGRKRKFYVVLNFILSKKRVGRVLG
jgi:hypothetical protein